MTLALVLVLPALAGCVQLPVNEPPASVPFKAGTPVLTMDLPIHVVAVGFSAFDAEALKARLVQPVPSYPLIRADLVGRVESEPLQYNLRYEIHEAPPAFAEALFAFMKTVSKEDKVDTWLMQYDLKREKPLCQKQDPIDLPRNPVVNHIQRPKCPPVDRIDAFAVEKWIAENRAAHGLDFGKPGQTVFVLDSWTQGHLAQDRYHQYVVEDGTTEGVPDMRAWGGTHDFVFLDLGAAPSRADFRPWLNFSRSDISLWDLEDRPVWDLASDPDTMYDNLGRNVVDAARMLWARSPIYPFEYAEKYILPIYVVLDTNARSNGKGLLSKISPNDYRKNTDGALLLKAYQDMLPWAEIDLRLTFIELPSDDPGLGAALEDAKSRYNANVDFGVVKRYIRQNWEKYAPQEPGAITYPSFGFILDAPSSGIYAYADGDEHGRSFGVFLNIMDYTLCLRANPFCTTEEMFGSEKTWWAWWNGVLLHELGHSFGLTHPHDTGGLDGAGWTTYEINWLWDSTSSIMTYRHTIPAFNAFDKELLLRGHAVNLARDVKALGDAAPADARAAADRALALVASGSYADALAAAVEARRLSDAGSLAVAAVGVPGTPVKFTIELPMGEDPVGGGPRLPIPFIPVSVGAGSQSRTFPIEVPEGATAVLIEFQEAAAPTHRFWSSSLTIHAEDGTYVTGAWNNAYDKLVLVGLERCGGSCTGRITAWSGVNLKYEVTVTPFTAA
ncbi:MAG TPA: hypothetical protein VM889_08180 [Candidatus Thermoplasmatota archaeon]|nr:hypothetical protein [Candidatus Thermoplasmatota archaeon]